MEIHEILLQKNGYVIASLATEFLRLEIGDRIKSVREFAEKYQVGNGTVQTALQRLEEIKAIEFVKQGHKGTILKSIDYPLLASICGVSSILGVMPLPYSKRYEGLATGIFECLNEAKMKANLAFMSGSKNRIDALLAGRYDFAVCSAMSAKKYEEIHSELEVVMHLHNESFINYHVLMARADYESDSYEGKRVGIDLSSDDQVFMTMQHFEKSKIQIVPIRYSNIVESLLNNEIDLAVWSTDNINLNDSRIKIAKIINRTENQEETQAAILTLRKNEVVKRYIKKYLDIEVVKQIQTDVIEGRKVAKY